MTLFAPLGRREYDRHFSVAYVSSTKDQKATLLANEPLKSLK